VGIEDIKVHSSTTFMGKAKRKLAGLLIKISKSVFH
jgi:hypothetical protein